VLNLFAEIYDTVSSRTPQRIEVITTLVGEDGVAAFSSRETLGATAAAGDATNARIPVMRQIPLKELRAGRYALRLEARALGGTAKPAVRETTVVIVP